MPFDKSACFAYNDTGKRPLRGANRKENAGNVDTTGPIAYNIIMEKVIDRDKRIVRVSGLGIGANILLVVGKIIVGVIAHSVSIISDAVNNLTDALSSIVTMVGTKLSGKRPDKKHPFGPKTS